MKYALQYKDKVGRVREMTPATVALALAMYKACPVKYKLISK